VAAALDEFIVPPATYPKYILIQPTDPPEMGAIK
jgi:hypothetical protein